MTRKKPVRILMIGDVIGKPGRRAVRGILPELRQREQIDVVIANAENAAGGFGCTPDVANELYDAGIDILTSGNHIWDQREAVPLLQSDAPIIRPLNYPAGVPGRGYLIQGDLLVVNLMGRTFMADLDCPFRAIDGLLQTMPERPPVVFIDMHAEATSEKVALAWYVDGRVGAVVGTHTHVPTADGRILPNGTALICDAGMTGPINSVIGSDIESVLKRFLTQTPTRLQVASGPCCFNSVLVDIDNVTGKALSIKRVDLMWDEHGQRAG